MKIIIIKKIGIKFFPRIRKVTSGKWAQLIFSAIVRAKLKTKYF